MGHREAGTLIGAAGGAVIGAVAYDKNRTKGAVVGAVGGALAGGAVGRYMDDQKRDLEKNLAAEIKSGQARVEKLPNDVVRITMTSQTAFDTNSADIKSGFHTTMDKIADVVVRYGKTTLTVVGHTDDVGSNAYNQSLSERRALSVAHTWKRSASTPCASPPPARAKPSRARRTTPNPAAPRTGASRSTWSRSRRDRPFDGGRRRNGEQRG